MRPAYFIPTFNKHVGEVCGGIEVHFIDMKNFKSVTVGLHLIKAYLLAVKDGSMKVGTGLDGMFGVRGTFTNIRSKEVQEILDDCKSKRDVYIEEAKKIYLYNMGEE